MKFWKYHGAGNDFIMVDQRDQQFINRNDQEKVAFLCNRHFGIGADGLILLQQHSDFTFEMVYFNADGRESSMCGNGGRCIVAFARQLGLIQDHCRFWAVDGEHEAKCSAEQAAGLSWVELKMGDVQSIEALLPPALAEKPVQEGADRLSSAFILNTGSPHYVRFVPLLDKLDIVQEGRAIRYSERFRSEGINVNLVQEHNNQLVIRTYERGVEDETLACGTGVTAAALAYYKHASKVADQIQVNVKARGGELQVRYSAHDDGSFDNIWLCGPAQMVFAGEILL